MPQLSQLRAGITIRPPSPSFLLDDPLLWLSGSVTQQPRSLSPGPSCSALVRAVVVAVVVVAARCRALLFSLAKAMLLDKMGSITTLPDSKMNPIHK